MRVQTIRGGFGFAAATLACMTAATPAYAWEPEKSVEIVVAAGAGGASDQMARMLQAAIQKNNLMKQPVIVTLKGAASGAEGLMYMKSSEGDPHKFIIAYSLIYTLPLAAKVPFDWRELTPVSIVAFDEFILWTNASAPYKTAKEFVEAAKASPTPFIFGGTGSKREDQIIVSALSQKSGAKFSYLPYKSGGEAATQLVGNHTQANVNNPSENSEVWRADQVRALCVFSDKRIVYKDKVTKEQSWNDIPTCAEEGLPIQYSMLRGIFLPGKVKADAAKYYVDLFAKIAETTEYKEYMKKQALAPASLTGADMIKFLEKDEAMHKEVMTEAGFVSN
jgi:putative tricarboxylic transport membrane protein